MKISALHHSVFFVQVLEVLMAMMMKSLTPCRRVFLF
jgi:hypothetical protein